MDTIKWLPSSSRYCKQSSHEKILYGDKLGDRRKLIEEPFNDKRAIIRCIGQLKMNFSSGNYVGTGTVFAVRDGEAYILTCAHNAVDQNEDNEKEYASSIKFEREIGKFGQTKEYDVKIVAVHDEYAFKDGDPNDLAVFSINDDDGYYKDIFHGNARIIHLFCSDNVNDQFPINYGLFGYPCPGANKYTKVQSGELWGMISSSSMTDKGIKMFIRKNKSKNKYVYNAIDTEGGQSGSALFMTLGDDTFGIVAVHTTGTPDRNMAVALNKDKSSWIEKSMNNKPIITNNKPITMKPQKPKHEQEVERGNDQLFTGEKVIGDCTKEEIVTLLTYINPDAAAWAPEGSEEKKYDDGGEILRGVFQSIKWSNNFRNAPAKKPKPSALECEVILNGQDGDAGAVVKGAEGDTLKLKRRWEDLIVAFFEGKERIWEYDGGKVDCPHNDQDGCDKSQKIQQGTSPKDLGLAGKGMKPKGYDGAAFEETSVKQLCQECMDYLIPPEVKNVKGKPFNTKLRGGVNQILRELKKVYVQGILDAAKKK